MDLKRKAVDLELRHSQTANAVTRESSDEDICSPLSKKTNTGTIAAPSNRSREAVKDAGVAKNGLSLSLPGLRFGTESWQGAKDTNEDRHIALFDRLPGALFGIFDGHGGCFTADFLVRNLAKNLTSTLRKRGLKENEILTLLAASKEESERKADILREIKSFQEQKDQLCGLAKQTGDDELDEMVDQLETTISEMTRAIELIDVEEKRREDQLEKIYADTELYRKAFIEAFHHTDAQLLKKNTTIDGSTALLLWFVGQKVSNLSFFVLNLGDCRAVLCRNGQGIPLSVDHKPDLIEERVRIDKAGGFVGNFGGVYRVYSAVGAGLSVQNGELKSFLAVSRAFGDHQLKTPSKIVSCEPDVKRFRVEADDLFVILACDGVWDVLSNQEAVDIALQHYKNPKAAADALVKQAYQKGSTDNLTATVIQFGWRDEQSEAALESLRKKSARGNDKSKSTQEGSSSQEEIDMFSI